MSERLTISSSLSIVRCDPARDVLALSLAATVWPHAERNAYHQGVQKLITTGRSPQLVLYAAIEHGALVAAQLGQAFPGNVAVVWPPAFANSQQASNSGLIQALFDYQAKDLAAEGAELAQALVDPRDGALESQFQQGGFSHAAELLYLAADTALPSQLPNFMPFDLEVFRPENEGRLAALIEATYEKTLDCPGMDGMRKTKDVLLGYQAVGAFRPDWWYVVRHAGEDVGCLLINLHPDVNHAEIVYLALVPEFRGRGWGRLLVQRALAAASEAGCDRVVLAVDAANWPAIGAYEQSGFEIFDRRNVWIRRLATK